ncbi:hypothetical protein GCM10010483_42090 [Actinokineospora diospyrosa]
MWTVARIRTPSLNTSCKAGKTGFNNRGNNPDRTPNTHPSPVLTLNGARSHSPPNPHSANARRNTVGTNRANSAWSRPRHPPNPFTSTTKIARYGGNSTPYPTVLSSRPPNRAPDRRPQPSAAGQIRALEIRSRT